MKDPRTLTEEIIREVLFRLRKYEDAPYVSAGVSNRHLHLSQEDLNTLFGSGYQLTKMKDLKQPGQFAAMETVSVAGPKGEIKKIRILGPVRKSSQLEISLSDSFKLGVKAPVRESGKTHGTPGIILKGPKGDVQLSEGVIVALRHIHMPPSYAEQHELKDKEMVSVHFNGTRPLTFDNVLIRISDQFELEMHLDTDEANAAGIGNGDLGRIMKG